MDVMLELLKKPVLECERVRLRPLTLADAEDMYAYASDEETVRYVFERHESLDDTRDNIARYFLANPAGKYAIELKAEGKMIGTIDIRPMPEHGIAELGYTLNRQYWGRGYMTEAAAALIALAFEQLGLEKVFAIHDVRNAASGKVMLRLGMQKEGVLRRHRIHKGEHLDMAYYGILREEYFRNQLD